MFFAELTGSWNSSTSFQPQNVYVSPVFTGGGDMGLLESFKRSST
jgi:hypothetical protein